MTVRQRFALFLFVANLMAGLSGCMPSSQGPTDEQKEPFFLTGKARESTLDYKGAIEAFEKALEVNPQNGSAHFELGLLYEKEQDFAAAIYHFERYLKLRPDSDRMQIVKDRILQNKMELSKTTAFAPVTQNLQKEFERLAEENRALRADNDRLRGDLAALQSRPPARDTGSSLPNPRPSSVVNPDDHQGVVPPPRAPSAGPESRPSLRNHTVKPGDTPTSIARKYNVKVETLLSLNPGLDPKRMKVGQSIKIPAS